MTRKNYWGQFVVPETIAMLYSATIQMALDTALYSLSLSARAGQMSDVTVSKRRITEMTVTLGAV